MIVADSSVWIAALRSGTGTEALHLGELLDRDEVALPVLVRLELLAGASPRQRRHLKETFAVLPVLYPSRATWKLIEDWIEAAARRGERFGIADLMIGALAAEAGAAVWSLDVDFARLGRLRFIEIFRPEN